MTYFYLTANFTQTYSEVPLVFFYGGAWEAGDRGDYRFVAQAFTALGYQVVIPDYRVYPDGLFPEFMSDAAQAVRWVANNTSDNVVLMGHSAGAHIAALLALDTQHLEQLGVSQKRIAGLVGLSGPYDFLPLNSSRLQAIFSAAEDINSTQPINFVTASAPPALLLHGSDDTTVKPFNSKRLAKELSDVGVSARMISYPNAGHAVTVGALSIPLRHRLSVLQDIDDFFQGIDSK
ncbi:alpha/beta hydrolase [Eionea flava]